MRSYRRPAAKPHTRDRDMQAATDEEVCELAIQEDRR
jgi:hypothetical protein